MSRNRAAQHQAATPPRPFKVFVYKREKGATEDDECGNCWLKAGMSLENACGSVAGLASVRYDDHRAINLAALDPNETGTLSLASIIEDLFADGPAAVESCAVGREFVAFPEGTTGDTVKVRIVVSAPPASGAGAGAGSSQPVDTVTTGGRTGCTTATATRSGGGGSGGGSSSSTSKKRKLSDVIDPRATPGKDTTEAATSVLRPFQDGAVWKIAPLTEGRGQRRNPDNGHKEAWQDGWLIAIGMFMLASARMVVEQAAKGVIVPQPNAQDLRTMALKRCCTSRTNNSKAIDVATWNTMYKQHYENNTIPPQHKLAREVGEALRMDVAIEKVKASLAPTPASGAAARPHSAAPVVTGRMNGRYGRC